MYIDTHAHLYTTEYDEDRNEVINEVLSAGVGKIILPAIDSKSHAALEKMAEDYPEVCYATIGVHPTSINNNVNYRYELEVVAEKLKSKREYYYAVGEIGIDLYWSKDFITEQIEAFRFQIELSLTHNLPIIIHARDSFSEVFNVLRNYKNVRGVFHGFSGTYEDYQTAKSLGDFKFGVGGVVTFKNSTLASVVEKMELCDIVLETDSPYLTPVPNRGKRNHPKYVVVVAQKIAELKGVQIDEVMSVTTCSAVIMFGV